MPKTSPESTTDLTWSIDNRGHYKIHERSGFRRIAPRDSSEATLFVAAPDLLAACEEFLARYGNSLFCKYVAAVEMGKIRQAVRKAGGRS